MPRFAIITTVRDGEAYLSGAIRSVINQTVSDWEMICFSDGSSDRTVEIGRRCAQDERRLRVVDSAPVGRAAALNAAIRLTDCDRIVILDADDALHPSCLQFQSNHAGEGEKRVTGCEIGLLFGSADPVWSELPVPAAVVLRDVTRQLATCNPIAHTGASYSRNLFDEIGGYTLSQHGAIDYRFYVDAARVGGRICNLGAKLVAKRIHPNQSFERGRRIAYLRSGLATQLYAVKVLQAGPRHQALAYGRFAYGLLPRWIRHLRYEKQ